MIIGLSGSIINLAIFSFLIYINWGNSLSATISFIFAATNNFFWNFKWTFKNTAMHKSTEKKYIQFIIISIINFFINLFFLNIFIKYLNFDILGNLAYHIPNLEKVKIIFSQILAIGITSVLNFFGNYLITFRGDKNV